MEPALALANNIKEAAPDQAVILTVHEMKRLARNAAELMQLSSDLIPEAGLPHNSHYVVALFVRIWLRR